MKRKTTCVFLVWLMLLGCRKEEKNNTTGPEPQKELTLEQVKAFYKGDLAGKIYWDKAVYISNNKIPYWLAGTEGRPKFHGLSLGSRKIAFYRDPQGNINTRILEIIPDANYLQQKRRVSDSDFTGRLFIYDADNGLLSGKTYLRGNQVGTIRPAADKKQVTTNKVQEVTECVWVSDNYVDAEGNAVIFSEKICTTAYIDLGDGGRGGGGDPFGGQPDSPPLSGGGGSPATPPAVSNLPGENKSGIDPKDLMNCFRQVPDKNATMKVTVYVQEPWPGTTFNAGPNSVGHTAVSLTKTNGSASITQTVGFYPDATGLDKMHAPSKIVDNGGDLEFNASITYTVTAENFNKIAAYISSPPGTYDLTRFNCTNFVYNACREGEITLPDPNDRPLLAPMEQVMTPGKLGDSIEKLKNNSNVNTNGGTVPFSHGPCK